MSPTAGSGAVLDAVIVGCGRIAGGYDEVQKGETVLTHAGAYRRHPGFRLKACVEPDTPRREAFAGAWGVEAAFPDLESCLASGIDLDVASVATPTVDHVAVLDRLLGTRIRAVLCEKPLAFDAAAATRIVSAYRAARRPLIVNYVRRFDPEIQTLKQTIASGAWGRLQAAVGFYGKGILHNGSHLVDLLQFLLGPIAAVSVGRSQPAHESDDSTVDAELATADGAPVHLVGTDFRDYDLFEVSLTFSRGQVVLEEGGRVIRERTVEDSPLYPGFRGLGRGVFRPAGQDKALLGAVDSLYQAVTDGAEPMSSGETALASERVCHRLLALATASQAVARR